MRLVEEEDELRLLRVADLRQRLVEAGEEPHHERAEQRGPVLHVGQLEDADDAAAVIGQAQEVLDLELRGAEERIGLLLLELDDLADDHAGGGGRDPAVLGHLGLALVRVEVVEQRAQVLEVDERQLLVVGVLEGQRQHRLLGVVQVEDLGQQDRPEARDRCAQAHALPLAIQGQELDRERLRRVVGEADGGGAARELVVELRRRGEPRDVALDVADEDRHAGVADSCSASTWSVFVLPVPVAPATRPWRFIIASGTRTWTAGMASSPRMPAPKVTPGASKP